MTQHAAPDMNRDEWRESTRIVCKRIFIPADPQDGSRVLVERLWPRGISKSRAAIDLWPKEIAPSSTLRRWYNHDPERWLGFQERYLAELACNPEVIKQLLEMAETDRLTLVYAAREQPGNSARVLRQFLLKMQA